MKQLTCEMCGSTDLIKQDGVFVCQSCQTKYSVEEAKRMMIEGTVQVEGVVQVANIGSLENYLSMAQHNYEEGHLDEAENYLKKIIEIDFNNYEAWLLKGKIEFLRKTLVYSNNRIDKTLIRLDVDQSAPLLWNSFMKAINYFNKAIDNAPLDKKDEIKNKFIGLICSKINDQYNDSVLDELYVTIGGVNQLSALDFYSRIYIEKYSKPYEAFLEYAIAISDKDKQVDTKMYEDILKIESELIFVESVDSSIYKYQKMLSKMQCYSDEIKKINPNYESNKLEWSETLQTFIDASSPKPNILKRKDIEEKLEIIGLNVKNIPKQLEQKIDPLAYFNFAFAQECWDDKQENDALLLAANLGLFDAQNKLGFIYEYGLNGVERNYQEAIKWYQKAAEQGDSVGQYSLSSMYRLGRGVEQSSQERFKWLKKSVEQGHASAQTNLAIMYENADGIEQDYQEAIKWYQKAAQQGDTIAQENLGQMYEEGKGVEKNPQEAFKWYQKIFLKKFRACHEDCQRGDDFYELAKMYEEGKGVEENSSEAYKYYRSAFYKYENDLMENESIGSGGEFGASTQLILGKMCEKGQGVKKDIIEAIKWYQKAQRNGNDKAQNALDRIMNYSKTIRETFLTILNDAKTKKDEASYKQKVQAICRDLIAESFSEMRFITAPREIINRVRELMNGISKLNELNIFLAEEKKELEIDVMVSMDKMASTPISMKYDLCRNPDSSYNYTLFFDSNNGGVVMKSIAGAPTDLFHLNSHLLFTFEEFRYPNRELDKERYKRILGFESNLEIRNKYYAKLKEIEPNYTYETEKKETKNKTDPATVWAWIIGSLFIFVLLFKACSKLT